MAHEREYRRKDIDENRDFHEEASAEVYPYQADLTLPENERPQRNVSHRHYEGQAGRGTGITAIVLSVISLFFLPVLMGAAGIIVGFVAKRQGAHTLGNWAIGIGIVAILVSLFFRPFY